MVRPSSKKLNDTMDFTNYVHILEIEDNNAMENSAEYINGVVLNCNIADKRMRSQIEKPKILLINGSLQQTQNEKLYSEIGNIQKQEQHFLKFLKDKINLVRPSIIAVEKNVSTSVLDTLRKLGITVIANVGTEALD